MTCTACCSVPYGRHNWVPGECRHATVDGPEDIFPDDSMETWKANADQEPLVDERVWPDDFKNFGSNVFGRRFGRG